MIYENILNPFCSYFFENEIVSKFFSTILLYFIALLIVELIVRSVKKWYKLFMIS